MSNTPNLNLELVPADSFQPWVAVNDALQVIDALVQLAVVSRTLSAPPTTVSGDVGKRWIVAAAPTGAWSGHATDVALCTGADLWRFIPAREGFEAWSIADTAKYRFTGGAWVLIT